MSKDYKILQIILKIFSGIFLIIAISGIILIYNIIWGKPTKFNLDFSNVLRGVLTLAYYIIFSSILAYGLFRSKKWSIYIYWVLLLGNYLLAIPILIDTSYESFKLNLVEVSLFIFLFLLVPLIIGIYLYKFRKKIFL